MTLPLTFSVWVLQHLCIGSVLCSESGKVDQLRWAWFVVCTVGVECYLLLAAIASPAHLSYRGDVGRLVSTKVCTSSCGCPPASSSF